MSNVAEIMQCEPVSFTGEETLEEAIRALREADISCAPIVVDGRLTGMVSEVALLDVYFDPQLRTAPVSDVAAQECRVVEPMTPLGRAAHLFGLTGLDCLPVVVGDQFMGLLRRRDLLSYALQAPAERWEPLARLVGSDGPAA